MSSMRCMNCCLMSKDGMIRDSQFFCSKYCYDNKKHMDHKHASHGAHVHVHVHAHVAHAHGAHAHAHGGHTRAQ